MDNLWEAFRVGSREAKDVIFMRISVLQLYCHSLLVFSWLHFRPACICQVARG